MISIWDYGVGWDAITYLIEMELVGTVPTEKDQDMRDKSNSGKYLPRRYRHKHATISSPGHVCER